MKKNTSRKKSSYYKKRKTSKTNSSVVKELKQEKKLKPKSEEKKVELKKPKKVSEPKKLEEEKKEVVKKDQEEIKFYPFTKVTKEDLKDETLMNPTNDFENKDIKQDENNEENTSFDNLNIDYEENESFDNLNTDYQDQEDLTNTVTFSLDDYKKEDNNSNTFDTNNNDSINNVVYKKSKHNFYLSYEKRLLLNIVAIIFLFVLASIVLLLSITIRARSSMIYNQSSNLKYDVTLKENDYYNDDNLSENMQYIASLIDYINVDFNYNFSASNTFDYTYTYYIESYVSVTDGEDDSKVIYSKIDRLTDPVTVANENSSGFNINRSVKINYDEYNDLVKEFKSTYGLSADSNLILSLRLEIKDKEGTVIRNSNSNNTTKITIPLTQQLVNIELDPEDVNNSNNIRVYQDFSISNKTTFILSIIIFLSAIASLVRLIVFIKKTSRKKSNYENVLSRILREYDRVIVNAKKVPVITGDVIDVNSFNELLDVRDNIEKPIIFYELHKGQKSVFIVNSDTNVYRYILKQSDLEK